MSKCNDPAMGYPPNVEDTECDSVPRESLTSLFSGYVRKERALRLRYALCASVLALLLCGCAVALVATAIELTKEVRADDGRLVASGTHATLQTEGATYPHSARNMYNLLQEPDARFQAQAFIQSFTHITVGKMTETDLSNPGIRVTVLDTEFFSIPIAPLEDDLAIEQTHSELLKHIHTAVVTGINGYYILTEDGWVETPEDVFNEFREQETVVGKRDNSVFDDGYDMDEDGVHSRHLLAETATCQLLEKDLRPSCRVFRNELRAQGKDLTASHLEEICKTYGKSVGTERRRELLQYPAFAFAVAAWRHAAETEQDARELVNQINAAYVLGMKEFNAYTDILLQMWLNRKEGGCSPGVWCEGELAACRGTVSAGCGHPKSQIPGGPVTQSDVDFYNGKIVQARGNVDGQTIEPIIRWEMFDEIYAIANMGSWDNRFSRTAILDQFLKTFCGFYIDLLTFRVEMYGDYTQCMTSYESYPDIPLNDAHILCSQGGVSEEKALGAHPGLKFGGAIRDLLRNYFNNLHKMGIDCTTAQAAVDKGSFYADMAAAFVYAGVQIKPGETWY